MAERHAARRQGPAGDTEEAARRKRQAGDTWEPDRISLASLVLAIRSKGVLDQRVLGALEAVPRRIFAGAEHWPHLHVDRPIAIDCGQTMPAPSQIGLLLQSARIEPSSKLLEIGTGSGYTAAVAARLAREVFSVERYQTLARLAEERVASLRLNNVTIAVLDGLAGWPRHAPFDRIVVSAATPEVPEAWLNQLKPNGILVLPLVTAGGAQVLTRIVKTDRGFDAESIADVRFVAIVPGKAQVL